MHVLPSQHPSRVGRKRRRPRRKDRKRTGEKASSLALLPWFNNVGPRVTQGASEHISFRFEVSRCA